jgi:muramidase (phage lysozyme)
MSIFRDTFQQNIKTQLEKRQDAMITRTPKVIQYLNSRNSWIRLSSSVNINGTADKAKNNVLLGGALDYQVVNGKDVYALRQGVGGVGNEAYSNFTPSGPPHRLGTRPMPGITNMDIKSKSAYGSLREATINFICWDIRQLEDLELLYMRPGYTVLVEWGWLPYLDNKGDLVTTLPNFYDILNKGVTNRTTIFKELYDKSTNSGGNYDAMFGYVKNYQWSAREDGGYDCQTTVISTGEIIESLKVNFVLPNLTKLNSSAPNGDGFLNDEFLVQGNFPSNKWKEHYEKNTLAGTWAEAYDKLKDPNSKFTPNSIFKDRYSTLVMPSLKSINSNNPSSLTGGSDFQVYITLEAVFNTIQKYIIPKDNNKNPLLELSLDTEGYTTGVSESLLCVAHPTQISVDPSVCVIKSPIWYSSGGILYAVSGAAASNPAQNIANELKAAVSKFVPGTVNTGIADFYTALQKIQDITTYIATEGFLSGPGSIQNYLSSASPNGIGKVSKSLYVNIITYLKTLLGNSNVQDTYTSSTSGGGGGGFGGSPGASSTNFFLDKVTITVPASSAAASAATAITSTNQAISNLKDLDKLTQSYFYGDQNGYDELGIIKNIYINLDFLYKLSLDANLEASDNKEKNEIGLYKYIKSIMSAVQTAIGNVSNFEIHVDPVDNKVRIIDINYTGAKSTASLFKLQVHNLNSVVRKYSLQSQIFPEQSSIIAIGSQAKGGQLGIQNNTMIDFNKSITDRIILEKAFPDGNNLADIDPATNSTTIASNLGSIVALFGSLATPPAAPVTGSSTPAPQNVSSTSGTDLNSLFSKSKSNLRDLIVYFQSVTNSPGANRNLIPIKFSFDMDGIGGLVIGHLFEINDDILPSGYKGIGAGSKLAQTVTSIGHSIGNGDWITKIDALNIILGQRPGTPFKDLKLQSLVEQSFKSAFNPTFTLSSRPTVASRIAALGTVSTFIPLGARPLLDLIAYTEGTAGAGQNGYDVLVGFGQINGWTPNYTGNHPNVPIYIASINNYSTAAGRYQFLTTTWNGLGLGAFNQENQDKGGWQLITNTGFTARDSTDIYTIAKSQIQSNAINVSANPKFLTFLDKTYKIWASLPSGGGIAGYSNQGGKYTPADVYNIFIEAIKKY